MLIQQTKRKKIKHKLLAWFTLATFVVQPALTFAQAVADPNAAAANRPVIDNAANNVPIVQIAAPSAAGVSHNLYQQLNIDPNGLIFNNSLGITSTQLAGYIAANPNLKGTAARIILNEVTGTGASYLKGYAEIAGSKADLIIANPNGIVGDGFGFINANRAVLTTGTPVFGGSGSLDAFRVTQGQITVQGQGIDATGADRLDLLSRAAAINAGLWAKDLNVVTGTNQVSYDQLQTNTLTGDGVQPTVALDVSALGGMYTHKIKLVGTEKGVGVNSQGTLAASSGDLTLTQEGKITLGGKTSASGNIAITAQDDIVHTGQLYGQTVAVQATGTLTSSGLLAAAGDTTLTAQTLQSTGTLGAGIQTDGKSGTVGNLTITTSGEAVATGRTVAAGDLVIEAASLDLAGGTTYAGHNASLTTTQGNLDNTGGTIEAGNRLQIMAQGTVANREGGSLIAEQITVTATAIDNHSGAISQSGSGATTLTAAQTIDNTKGKIRTNGLAAANAKALYNAQGILAAEQGIALQADTLNNQHGTIASAGAVQLTTTGSVTNAAGIIEAGHGLALTAASLDNTSGSITSLGQEDLTLTVGGDLANQSGLLGGNGVVQVAAGSLDNQAGKVTAKDNLTIQSETEIDNSAGTLLAGQNISLMQATGTLTNTAGTIQAGQDLAIAVDRLNSTGKLLAGRDVTVTANDVITTGQLIAGRDLQLTSGTLLNQGTVQADGSVILQADGTLTNDGNLTALQGLAISGKDIQNSEAGAIKSGGTLHLDVTDSLTNAGTVYGKGELQVQAGEVTNTGALASASHTSLTADTLTSTGTLAAGLQSDGTLGTTGDLSMTTTGSAAAHGQNLAGNNLVIQGATVDLSDGTTSAGNAAIVTATNGDLDNTGGSLTAKYLTIQAQGALVNNKNTVTAGSIKAEQLSIQADEIRNQGGIMVQYGQTDITLSAANGIDNTDGQIATNSTNLTIDTSTFTNTHGQVQHAGNGLLTLDAAGNVANDAGKIISNGALNLSAQDINNTQGTLTAQRQVDITATSVDNTQGVIVGKDAVTLTIQGAVVNREGTLEAGKGLSVTARSLDNQGGSVISLDDSGLKMSIAEAITNARGLIGSNGDVQIAADSLANTSGRVVAKADLAFAVDGPMTNTKGMVSAGHNLTIDQVTGSLMNDQGTAQAGNDLTIHTTEMHNTAGQILANRDLMLAGTTATNSGVLYGGRDIQVTLEGNITNAAGGEMLADRNLTLTADGSVTNSGKLTALGDAAIRGGNLANTNGASLKSGQSLTLSTTSNLSNDGSIYAKEDVAADSAGTLSNSGAVAAGSDTTLTVQSIQSTGTLIAGIQEDGSVGTDGALTVTATETASLNGRNLAGHTITVTGKTIDNSNSTTYAGTRAALTATTGDIDNSGGTLTAKEVAINAQGAVNNNKNAQGAARIQADKLSLQAKSIHNQGGTIVQYGQNDLTLIAEEGINNSGGQIATNSTNLTIDTNQLTNGQGQIQHAGSGNLVLTTSSQLDNTQGRIISNGAVTIDSGTVTNTNGSVSAKEQLTMEADSLTNRQGVLVSQKAMQLTVQGAADNQQGLVEAGIGLQLTAQSLDNGNGKLTSLDDSGLTLITDGEVHNQAGLIGSNGAITITANGLTNTGGQVQAKTDLTVQAAHDVTNTAGTLSAGRDLTLTQQAGTLTNTQGTIQAGNDLSVHAATIANTQGRLLAARDAILTGQTVTNSGTLYGGRDVHVDLTGAFTNSTGGEIQADRKVALTAGGTLTNQGKITALQTATLQGAAISNSAAGAIKSGGNMTLAADGNLTNTGTMVAQGKLKADSGAALTSTGVLAAAGNATIQAQQVTASGTLAAGIQSDGSLGTSGDLTVTAANAAALQGQTLAAHDLTVTGAAVDLSGGTAYAGHTAAITATTGSIDNTGATLEAKDTAKLTAVNGSVVNNKNTAQFAGTIRAGQLDITAKTIRNQGGALIQYGTGDTAITTTAIDNTGGQLATNGTNLTLSANTILNTNGQIQHAGTGVFSLQAAAELDNTGGRFITNGAGDIDTAVITNTSGTVSAQKQLTVDANSLNSEQGILVTKDTLTVTAQGSVNNRQGIIEAGKGLSLIAQAVDNEHGSITSLGEQTLSVTATGAVNNQSGMIGGNGQVTVTAASLANQSGTVQAQGNLTVITPQGVNNTQGTLSAGKDLTLTQTGSTLVNDQGKVEAGQSLNVKTKEIINTAGRLAANKNVALAFTGLTGDGTVEAGQDLALTIAGSFTNEAGNTWKANDNVTIAATGAITNRGSLEAGDNLTVSGSSVINEATGLLAANKELTVTTAGDFTNMGSAFGKELTVTADHIVNANETAVIAANDNVKLFAATSVANLDGATIYSQGDIAIAGSAEQDATGQYVTRTGELLNQSASIEADRDIAISADVITNKVRSYTVEEKLISETRYDQKGVYSHPNYENIYGITTQFKTTAVRLTPGSNRDMPAIWLLAETVSELDIKINSPVGRFLSGRNMLLDGSVINNEYSEVLAGNKLITQADAIVNNLANSGQRIKKRLLVKGDFCIDNRPFNHFRGGERYDPKLIAYFFEKPYTGENLGYYSGYIGRGYTETVTEQLPGGSSAIFGGGKSLTIQGTNINNVTLSPGSVTNVVNTIMTSGLTSSATNQSGNNTPNSTSISTNVPGSSVVVNTGSSIASSGQAGSAAVTQTENTVSESTDINANVSNDGMKINIGSGVNSSGQAINAAVSQGNSYTITPQINTKIPTGDIPPDSIQTLLPSAQTGPVTPPQTNNGGTITVPANGMYAVHTEPTAHYLVETNSRFTSYKNFISSDYMLEKLNIDPAATMKRLGDGFYEQKLVREQITDLTGRVYLSGYDSAEAQYQALLENGAAVAQTFHLQVGIALSDEQMKQLTMPIVWMVEQEVNGQKVLVPVVYLPQVREGDLKANGAVIAADVVTITTDGKVTNAGTIKAEKAQISAAMVSNLGGSIDGGNLTKVAAAEDLFNLSGTITGDNVSLSAGKNFTSETATFTSEVPFHKSTTSGNTATVSAGQNLTISAGQDLNLLGSQLTAGADLSLTAGGNLDASSVLTQESWNAGNYKKQQVTNELTTLKSGGNLTIGANQDITLTGVQASAGENLTMAAGGDILLNTVKDSSFSDVKTGNSKNYKRVMTNDETVIGTNLAANQDLTINTGSSLTMEGSSAVSENGKIAIAAADGITIGAVTETHEALTESKKTKSGFLSKKTTIKKDYSLVNEVVGSTISGDSVEITAGTDLTVQAGNIVGTHDVSLTAGNDLTIVSAAETGSAEHYKYTKKSGLFSGGGLGFTIGSQSEKSTLNEQTLGEIGTKIGSVEGSVTLTAGNQVNSAGTAFISAKDLDITGKTVNIDNTVDTYDSQSKYEFKQSGLSVSLNGGAAQTAMNAVGNIERASQVSDERLQALYAYKAYEDVEKLSKIKDEAGAKKGVSVSVSIGSSKFTSEQTVHSETVNTSDITAGGTVTIKATEGDVNLSGVKLDAKDLTITAADNINIDAAQNKLQIDTNTSSSSWAVGASLGTNTSYFANASKGSGKEDQDTVTQVGSLLNADGTVQLVTGKDLTISGSQVKGESILADIGGDLNIVSLQDTDNYIAKNKNSGIGVSTGPSGGVTGSYSQGKTNSTYASVTEQAGIFAGEGGFDITVGGNTDLKGAVISSDATQDKNKLSTDTLTFSDIQNKAEYSASSTGVNLDTRKTAETKDAGLTPDIGTKATGDADSTTKSAIAEGTVEVRNGDTDLSNLSRDTANSLNALGKIFDKKTVAEQQELAKVFSEVAFEEIHKIAKAAYKDAADNGNLEEMARWQDGGSYKVALHALVGGLAASLGGADVLSGTVGAGVNEAVQQELEKLKDPALHQWASLVVGGAAAAVVGGEAQTGGSEAASGTKNNIYKDGDIQLQSELRSEKKAEITLADGSKVVVEIDDQAMAEYALPIVEALEKMDNVLDAYDFAASQLPPAPPGMVIIAGLKSGKVVVTIAKIATGADEVLDLTRGSSKALEVPGRVQSRINIRTGSAAEGAGFEHVLDRHFSAKNASQFTVTPDELKSILQSQEVVNTPVSKVLQAEIKLADGTKIVEERYVREVTLKSNVGIDKFNNSPTNVMTILTDKFGNLVTATPGVIK